MSDRDSMARLVVELSEVTREFSVEEMEAVLFVARRLEFGRKKYGALQSFDGRNWLMEAAEEAADMLVYLYANARVQQAAYAGEI